MLIFIFASAVSFINSFNIIRIDRKKFLKRLLLICYILPFFVLSFNFIPGVLKLLYIPYLIAGAISLTAYNYRPNIPRQYFIIMAMIFLFILSALLNRVYYFTIPLSLVRLIIPFLLLYIFSKIDFKKSDIIKGVQYFMVIGLIQVPIQFYQYLFLPQFASVDISRVDIAMGTFGLKQSGTLAVYYVLLYLLLFVFKSEIFESSLIFIAVLVVLTAGFLITFSGGGLIILVGMFSILFLFNKNNKNIKIILPIALMLISVVVFWGKFESAYVAEDQLGLVDYAQGRTATELASMLNSDLIIEGNGSRAYGLFRSLNYANNSAGGLTFGGGPGTLLQAQVLESSINIKSINNYYDVFGFDTIVNTWAYLIGELGFIFLFLFMYYFIYPCLKFRRLKINGYNVYYPLLVVFFMYSFYYNIVFDYQFLLIFTFCLTQFKNFSSDSSFNYSLNTTDK